MLCSFHNAHTKKELVSEYIFFQNLYWVKLYLRKSHTNKVLFPTSHNAPCLPRPKFCIIFNFSQDYCSTLEKKSRRNLSGNWVISIFSGLKLKITQLPGGFRVKNKGYAKRWGANKVYLLWETCKWQKLVLCASSQVSKTLKWMQGRNRPLGLVLGELITLSGVRGGGGGRLYNIPAEGGGSFTVLG